MSKIPTEVYFSDHLPALKDLHPPKLKTDFIFVVDQQVLDVNRAVKNWLKAMPFVYPVAAGEQLKSLSQLSQHLENIFALLGDRTHRNLTLVAVGGGSVGDFAGFVASIFKRGIDYIQIPSSWLAAIDSAHGGKTALNLRGLKNQIGTFHHPKRVFIVKEVLKSQSNLQLTDSLAEIHKMSLLTRKPWGRKWIALEQFTPKQLWHFLPDAVQEKYRIVGLDPSETKGIRFILNLGHTFGHILELEQRLPHGRSVAIGLKFALQFSHELGLLNKTDWTTLQESSLYASIGHYTFRPLSEKRFTEILVQDKKKTSSTSIQFVLLKKIGHPIVKAISINELISAGRKYGFIRTP